jgi:D-glycero-D-manno-heptose 1,7-bisphosphate phosphatase
VSDASQSALLRELKTVFLDRDGVLNEKMPEGEYVRSLGDLHVLPGVPDAIARLNRAGMKTIVVSNQRGIASGLYTNADVDGIHAQIQRNIAGAGGHIDAFFYCPHDENECDCRKPLGGLFHQAAAQFPGVEAKHSAMIGDSLTDIEFGRRLGMLTVFLEGDREKPGFAQAVELADLQFKSLPEAVDALLDRR